MKIYEQSRNDALEKIDTKAVKTAYIILLVFIILEIISVAGTAIYLWSTSRVAVPGYTIEERSEIDTGRVVVGFLVLFGGTLSSILEWFLLKPIIGMMYDIKIIRYHLDSEKNIKEEVIK